VVLETVLGIHKAYLNEPTKHDKTETTLVAELAKIAAQHIKYQLV
jgi:hypothetical protein